MKPDRGPVRETRIPATASHRMAVPRGFPRENADRENAGQRREARDFETIEIPAGSDFRCRADRRGKTRFTQWKFRDRCKARPYAFARLRNQ